MSEILIEAKQLTKSYQRRGESLDILKGIDLQVCRGDALCIVGASGAGKSTLLNILGTLDQPDSGQLYYQNKDLLNLRENQLASFRNHEMGFVFQFHHLLSEFTALENVLMPSRIQAIPGVDAEEHARELLDFLGLNDRLTHYPSELSGGERQRVAIARALIQKPKVLLADEPTGNLDSKNSENIEEHFFQLHEKLGLTLIVVTHDEVFSRRFSKRKLMIDGLWAE